MAKKDSAPAKGALEEFGRRGLAAQRAVDQLTQPNPDEAFLVDAGRQVVDFLKQLAGFFSSAQRMEGTAKQVLDAAKLLLQPTSGNEDVLVQEFIKTANSEKKAVLEHWKITALVSQFHKRLTGRRDVAVKMLEEA